MVDRSQSGFTLLEVMVALAILAIAFSALIKVVQGNISNQIYLEDRTYAQWVGLNRIALVKLSKNSLEVVQSTGIDRLAGRDWQWSMKVLETPDQQVRRIEVMVHKDEDNEHSYAMVTGFVGMAVE